MRQGEGGARKASHVSSDFQPDARFRRSESVAHRRIEDEVLLIPIRTDPREGLAVFSLNPTAALLWDLLEQTHAMRELVGALCERFEVSEAAAAEDVARFCSELVGCGALQQVDAETAAPP